MVVVGKKERLKKKQAEISSQEGVDQLEVKTKLVFKVIATTLCCVGQRISNLTHQEKYYVE